MNSTELAQWLQEHRDPIRSRWLSEVRNRAAAPLHEAAEGLLVRFLDACVTVLPGTLGPFRTAVEPLWRALAELYGNVSTMRGLATGEAIEEFQLLREAVVMILYQQGGAAMQTQLSLRDLLRLNRSVDRGVVYASVGYTDALFFTLFQGSGVREELNAERVQDVSEEIRLILEEYDELMSHLD